jgi:hypothetical protein
MRPNQLPLTLALMFVFVQLSAGLVTNYSIFASVAFAKKGDKDKDNSKGKKGFRQTVNDL